MKLKNSYKSLFIFKLIILLICVSVFCYLLYRDIVFHDNELSSYYFKYHIISSLLIFCSLIFFFLKNEIFFNFITVIISLIVTFFLIEIYLFFIQSKFDTNQQIEYLISDKNNQNLKSAIMPGKFFYEDLKIKPLSGLASVNTVYCNESGYFSKYFSDQYGFNNPKDAWGKENDVILIGDSFVHGACVDEGNDISSFMRKDYNLNVLNLGMGGIGPLVQLAILKEYAHDVKTKNIILVFTESNDFTDLEEEKKIKYFLKYLSSDELNLNKFFQEDIDKYLTNIYTHEFNKMASIYKKESEIIKILKFYYFRNFLEKNLFFHFYDHSTENQLNYLDEKLFLKILRNFKNFSKSKKSELFILYLPEYNRYVTSNSVYYDKLESKVYEIATKADIEFISLVDYLDTKKDILSFFPKNGGHYNYKGYELISSFIYNKVIKND